MTIAFLDQKKGERLQTIMNTDAEFKLAARFMSEDVLFAADDSQCIVRIQDGVVTEIKYEPSSGDHWSFSIQATADSWDKLLQLSPPPFYTVEHNKAQLNLWADEVFEATAPLSWKLFGSKIFDNRATRVVRDWFDEQTGVRLTRQGLQFKQRTAASGE